MGFADASPCILIASRLHTETAAITGDYSERRAKNARQYDGLNAK